MPDTNTEMRVRFASILLSAPCQNMDFWCGGLHVSGAGLALIAHALSGGGRHGKGVRVVVEPVGKNAAAQYDQFRNAIVVPKRGWAKRDTFERIGTVHEAVHALRDAYGARLTFEGHPFRPRAATDEAAAYVAGCLYDVYVQQEGGGTAVPSPAWLAARKSPTHALAYGVALRQAAKPAGSAVDRSDLATLFRTITQYSIKTEGTMTRFYEFNGIRGVRPP